MVRSTPWRATSLALTTLFGCGRDERLRATTIDVECIDALCRSDFPDASAPSDAARGASDPVDGATPRGGIDGAVPPYGDGGPADAAPSSVDGARVDDGGPIDDPLVGRTVCTAPGPRAVAFRTDLLDPVPELAGSGIPGAPAAFRRAWRNALAQTGRPGPALLVLSDIGPLPLGTPRGVRVGTPAPSVALDAGEGFGFARDSHGDGGAAARLSGTYAVQNATHVRASLLGGEPIALRFYDDAGEPKDIPVIGVALEAFFRSDPSGRCTALDVVDLALGFASASLDATLDGVPLATLLGVTAPASSITVVHLAGPAPSLTFVEGAP